MLTHALTAVKEAMRTLPNIRAAIDFLGGPDGVAAIACILTASEVRRWIADNSVPNSWHYRLHLWCASRGGHLHPGALGFTSAGHTAKLRRVHRGAATQSKKRRGK